MKHERLLAGQLFHHGSGDESRRPHATPSALVARRQCTSDNMDAALCSAKYL